MPRKFMAILAAAFMVVAASAFASSAGAVVFTLTTKACSGGTNVALCFENAAKEKLELEGEQSETVSGGTTTLVVLGEPAVTITCQTATGVGTIVQKEPLTAGAKTTIKEGTITYEGCEITGTPELAAKCTIPTVKTTNKLKGELTSETELLLKPETGTVFIEIPFTSKTGQICPATVKGTRSVTGEQVVTILEPAVAQEKKTGKSVTESKLEFFSNKADLTEELTMSFTGLGDNVYVSKIA